MYGGRGELFQSKRKAIVFIIFTNKDGPSKQVMNPKVTNLDVPISFISRQKLDFTSPKRPYQLYNCHLNSLLSDTA